MEIIAEAREATRSVKVPNVHDGDDIDRALDEIYGLIQALAERVKTGSDK